MTDTTKLIRQPSGTRRESAKYDDSSIRSNSNHRQAGKKVFRFLVAAPAWPLAVATDYLHRRKPLFGHGLACGSWVHNRGVPIRPNRHQPTLPAACLSHPRVCNSTWNNRCMATELSSGKYRITTATGSVYDLVIRPESSSLTRRPGELPVHPSMDGAATNPLRRDAAAIAVLAIHQLSVGEPAVFVLDLRRDGIPTLRTTSTVITINRVG